MIVDSRSPMSAPPWWRVLCVTVSFAMNLSVARHVVVGLSHISFIFQPSFFIAPFVNKCSANSIASQARILRVILRFVSRFIVSFCAKKCCSSRKVLSRFAVPPACVCYSVLICRVRLRSVVVIQMIFRLVFQPTKTSNVEINLHTKSQLSTWLRS